MTDSPATGTETTAFRDFGPAEEWYCRCHDYGNHVVRPASMRECVKCKAIAPWTEMVNRRV